MKKLWLLIFFLSFSIVNAHPKEQDALMVAFPCLSLSYQKYDFYKAQFDLDFKIYKGIGYYKNIFQNGFDFEYGLRILNNDKIQHRFRFLMIEDQGLFYKTLLKYGNPYPDTSGGEFIFGQCGLKLLEFSNIDLFSELKIFQVSSELILENRTYHEKHYLGLPYEPNNHNFYFIPRVTIEVSHTSLDNSIVDPSLINTKASFWDIPIGAYLELGYDWRHDIEIPYKTKLGIDTGYRRVINSALLFLDYKLYPFNNMKNLTYGIRAKIDPNIWILNFNAEIKRSQIIFPNIIYSFYNYSIGMNAPVNFFKY